MASPAKLSTPASTPPHFCRFAGDESVSSERTSLATCIAAACERTLGTVHECIADSAGACSAESSFNGGANDENAAPDALIASDASPTPPAATAQPQPPPLLRQLHALQTFSACLYTQDLVGEVFIHSILDHVRYSTASWPEGARNAAVRGLCDMTLFCGKRLETLGTLRSTMPDIYSHLELLAAGTALTQDTRDRIANTLELRARGWQPPTTPGAEETLGTVVTRAHTTPPATPERSLTATAPVATGDQELSLFGLAQIKPEAKSPKKEDISGDEPVLGFGAMLGAAGLSVESCAMPVAGSAAAAPLAGFPMLEPDEPRVKVEDMLAAVQDMGV